MISFIIGAHHKQMKNARESLPLGANHLASLQATSSGAAVDEAGDRHWFWYRLGGYHHLPLLADASVRPTAPDSKVMARSMVRLLEGTTTTSRPARQELPASAEPSGRTWGYDDLHLRFPCMLSTHGGSLTPCTSPYGTPASSPGGAGRGEEEGLF